MIHIVAHPLQCALSFLPALMAGEIDVALITQFSDMVQIRAPTLCPAARWWQAKDF